MKEKKLENPQDSSEESQENNSEKKTTKNYKIPIQKTRIK